MKRALRRHHKERMKMKAARIYPALYDNHGNLLFPAQYYLADNLQVCSCFGCGNQRKYQGKSRGEKMNMNDFCREAGSGDARWVIKDLLNLSASFYLGGMKMEKANWMKGDIKRMKKTNWIKVEDQLPNEKEIVIIKKYNDNPELLELQFGSLNNGKWYFVDSNFIVEDVSHWLPNNDDSSLKQKKYEGGNRGEGNKMNSFGDPPATLGIPWQPSVNHQQ